MFCGPPCTCQTPSVTCGAVPVTIHSAAAAGSDAANEEQDAGTYSRGRCYFTSVQSVPMGLQLTCYLVSGVVSGRTVRALVLGRFSQKK